MILALCLLCLVQRLSAFTNTGSCSNSATKSSAPEPGSLGHFLDWFKGDFDNFEQIQTQRLEGIEPREGGGHEHIHCRINRAYRSLKDEVGGFFPDGSKPDAISTGRYYFNGNPEKVFRYRIYALYDQLKGGSTLKEFVLPPSELCEQETTLPCTIMMRPCRFDPSVEDVLKACSYDEGEVKDILRGLLSQSVQDQNQNMERISTSGIGSAHSPDPTSCQLECLPSCDVVWGWNDNLACYEGCMLYGEATIKSQMNPTMDIVIKDDLKLWEDKFWVNDRGTTPDGKYVYGNIYDKPYKMRRVTPNSDLNWTLGKT